MSAFTPASAGVVVALVAALAAVLTAGFGIVRIPRKRAARAAAWALVIASVVFAERATAAEPAGIRMLAVIGLLLYAMKAVVGVESATSLSPLRWFAFAALWPGMRPTLFADSKPVGEGAWALVGKGVVRIAIGAGFLIAGRVVWSTTGSLAGATALVLPGISLVLHFGLFNIAAGAWRALGIDADSLFRAPLLSTTLKEFWGRRWNLAFSEMTAAGVYRPVSGLAGRRAGIAAAFLASGLLHELAISGPVKAGFGLPLLYFAIHAVAMLVEPRLPLERHPWLGRAWTTAWLLLPLPLLFHPAFLRGVVWPLTGIDAPQ
mgnify:CR=1 FL=1